MASETKRVFIVDDRVGDLDWLLVLIRRRGYTVVLATNEQAARQRLEAVQRGEESYVLAIMDIMVATHDLLDLVALDEQFFENSRNTASGCANYARRSLGIPPEVLPIVCLTAREDEEVEAAMRERGIRLFHRAPNSPKESIRGFIEEHLMSFTSRCPLFPSAGLALQSLPNVADTAKPILIAGGGIGGLTAAVALRRAGFDGRGLRAGRRRSARSARGSRSSPTPSSPCGGSGSTAPSPPSAASRRGSTCGPRTAPSWPACGPASWCPTPPSSPCTAPRSRRCSSTRWAARGSTPAASASATRRGRTAYPPAARRPARRRARCWWAPTASIRGCGSSSWATASPLTPATRRGGPSPRKDFAPRPAAARRPGGAATASASCPIEHGRVYWYATSNAPPGGRDEPGVLRDSLLRVFGELARAHPGADRGDPGRRHPAHRRPPSPSVRRWGRGG